MTQFHGLMLNPRSILSYPIPSQSYQIPGGQSYHILSQVYRGVQTRTQVQLRLFRHLHHRGAHTNRQGNQIRPEGNLQLSVDAHTGGFTSFENHSLEMFASGIRNKSLGP